MEKRSFFKKLSGQQLTAAGLVLLILLFLPLKVTLTAAAIAMIVAGVRETQT